MGTPANCTESSGRILSDSRNQRSRRVQMVGAAGVKTVRRRLLVLTEHVTKDRRLIRSRSQHSRRLCRASSTWAKLVSGLRVPPTAWSCAEAPRMPPRAP